ncbi:MAG: 2-octaprenyl-6-methoxyphenyl hydroxylase [Xanthomonadales bacterium]|nr:2-octaprenyl-6-methoxyphenyl hydroxylase [Xanthomonadales bacterium]
MSADSANATSADIAVVGGGLVGATLAYALSVQGWQVAMMESVEPRAEQQPSYDDRTLALAWSASRILSGLGIWDALEDSATPIRRIIVRELEGPGRVELDPAEHGLEQFGHVVEARAFGAAMMALLPELESLQSYIPATVTGVEAGAEQVELTFKLDGRKKRLDAALVVGADGATSFVRKAVGIGASEHDYGQTAVVCNITPSKPHAGRAFECFTSTGPFAILPHRGERCGLVWCLSDKEAKEKLELSEEEFLAAAQKRFGDELGRFKKIGRRSSYPLKQVRAERDIAERTVLLGNAAHAIHPIGAQGFNLGLRDVAVLAELLAEARQAGGDPGDPGLLKAYHNWRRYDQSNTIGWTDALARLYARPGLGASLARTAGLIANRLLPPLRKQVATRAMGYQGRIPRLALGEPLDLPGE